jgi:hypothetical protein
MEFLVCALLEFKHFVPVDVLEAADEDLDYSDVLWRTPRPVNPLRPLRHQARFVVARTGSKRCDLGFETGRDLAKSG